MGPKNRIETRCRDDFGGVVGFLSVDRVWSFGGSCLLRWVGRKQPGQQVEGKQHLPSGCHGVNYKATTISMAWDRGFIDHSLTKINKKSTI